MVDLVANGIATAAPTIGSPAIGQVHVLLALGIVTDTPEVGSPKLTEYWHWMFRPMPDSTEVLSWMTDVMRSDTSEMRVSLRPARSSMSYDHNLRDQRNARAEAVLRAAPRSLFLVPVWPEASTVGAVLRRLGLGKLAACAQTSAGAVSCWGGNGRGQLGNGTTTNANSPVTASGITMNGSL